jgi:hypothetical protein
MRQHLDGRKICSMGLKAPGRVTPTASYADLVAIVATHDEMGAPSLGTVLMVTWERWQREGHILTAFEISHYRPQDRPYEVLIVHPKTANRSGFFSLSVAAKHQSEVARVFRVSGWSFSMLANFSSRCSMIVTC